MSHAELAAHKLYETMHLECVSEEVKRHLIILMLSNPSDEVGVKDHTDTIKVPQNYMEALEMGAIDLSLARKELHAYVDRLSEEYHLQ